MKRAIDFDVEYLLGVKMNKIKYKTKKEETNNQTKQDQTINQTKPTCLVTSHDQFVYSLVHVLSQNLLL